MKAAAKKIDSLIVYVVCNVVRTQGSLEFMILFSKRFNGFYHWH